MTMSRPQRVRVVPARFRASPSHPTSPEHAVAKVPRGAKLLNRLELDPDLLSEDQYKASGIFEVEDIFSVHLARDGTVIEYEVKWLGFSSAENSWVTPSALGSSAVA